MKPKAKTKPKAQHSASLGDWRTPIDIVESARRVLRRIDLDPASDEGANEIIRARKIYTAKDDGLEQQWKGRIFVNPPGSCGLAVCGNTKVCSCDLVRRFWRHLMVDFASRSVSSFVWVGFSLEQLSRLQSAVKSPLDFRLCIPRRRLKYWRPGVSSTSPTHSSYIAHGGAGGVAFYDEFRRYGKVIG